LISYGGMSREALKIPVGLQIFNGLTCHGLSLLFHRDFL